MPLLARQVVRSKLAKINDPKLAGIIGDIKEFNLFAGVRDINNSLQVSRDFQKCVAGRARNLSSCCVCPHFERFTARRAFVADGKQPQVRGNLKERLAARTRNSFSSRIHPS